MDLDDAKEKLIIEKNLLDDELINQPILYQEVAEQYALAISRRDAANENVKRVDADLYKRIREAAAVEGTKVTEAMIQSEILTHPEHIEAYDAYLECKKQADLWATLKDSYSQRSYAIRDLVELYTAGYFADAGLRPKTENAAEKQYDVRRKVLEEARAERKSRKKLKKETSEV